MACALYHQDFWSYVIQNTGNKSFGPDFNILFILVLFFICTYMDAYISLFFMELWKLWIVTI